MPYALRIAIAFCQLLAGLNAIILVVLVTRAIGRGTAPSPAVLLVLGAAGLFWTAARGLLRRRWSALASAVAAITLASIPVFSVGTGREVILAQVLHALVLVAALLSWPHLRRGAVGA